MLPASAGSFADDGEGAGIGGEFLNQIGHKVVDVHPAILPRRIPEEGEHPLALGNPAVLRDDFGGRLRRQGHQHKAYGTHAVSVGVLCRRALHC